MQPSRMRLEHYFVDEASFRLRESALKRLDGEPPLEPDDMDIEVHLGEDKEDALKRFCQLDIKLTKETARKFPYSFKVVMVGFFELDADCSTEDQDILMTNTAPSMLYTAAREYLLTITGRTRYIPIMLPTVLFVPKEKTKPRRKKTASKSTARRTVKTQSKGTK